MFINDLGTEDKQAAQK